MTPSGSDPPRTPDPPRDSGSAPGPEGFYGIGGHLIRPVAPVPLPTNPAAALSSHGAHLLAPIVPDVGGSRTATCPVCRTNNVLPPSGGWVPVRCAACGTEFVATDGSPPPAPPVPAPSPIAPLTPLEPRAPESDLPRGFTSAVRTAADGRRRVTCPQCRRAEVDIPRSATVAVVLRCPLCHLPFLVNLDGDPARPPPSPVPPRPGPPPTPLTDSDGRLWDYCPKCGYDTLTPGRIGGMRVLTCGICGTRIIVTRDGPPPPPSPSLWERIRKWLGGG